MVETGEGQPTTWKFTQCFGDKGDVEDITEGMIDFWDRCTLDSANLETSQFRRNDTVRTSASSCVQDLSNSSRKKLASTSFTLNSNPTNPNSIT
jgi:hypothetical protein